MALNYDTNWKREYSLLYGVVVLYSLRDWIKEETGKEVAVRGEGVNGWFRSCSEHPYFQKAKEILLSKIRENPLYFQKEIELIQKSGEQFVNFTKSLNKVSDKTKKEELISFYKDYFKAMSDYGLSLWKSFNLVEMTSIVFEDFIKKEFSKDKITEAIKDYSYPSKKAAIFLIQEYFEEEKSKENHSSFIKERFPWIFSTDPALEINLDEKTSVFVDSFSHSKELSPKNQKLSLKDNQIIKMYQDALHIKDKRDDYRREAFYLALPLMRELSKRLNISVADLGFMLPEEVSSKDYKSIIQQRKEGYLAELINNKLTIKAGEEAKSAFIPDTESNNIKSFKGIVGCTGIAKGKVKILIKREDIASFKKGNVLVSITTNPEHMPAMQKASAFITDEGGITCHAAIVARELNKPCIIGTKIATQVLKDGDIVEVDADKGVVRII